MIDNKSDEETINRPSEVTENNNSLVSGSANNSLISDKKKIPKRTMITGEEKKKIAGYVENQISVKKDEIVNFEKVSIKKSLFFRLYVSGTIDYGNFSKQDPIKTKYEFVAGDYWEREDGAVTGETQFSCLGEGLYNYYSYGKHFEISYRSTNPFGWPQLVLNCSSIDEEGNEVVKGYGCVHVPASTGRHERIVHIFNVTNGSSFWDKFCLQRMFCCESVENKNKVNNTPKVISSGQGRDISRAVCEGWIKVIFQVGFRDMDKFGLVVK